MDLHSLQLNYADQVNENLICTICCQPFIEPVTSPCKHYFCRNCIDKALDVKEECPIDRLPLKRLQILLAPNIILNMVNELKVDCPNQKKGCTYTSQRHLIIKHLEKCEYAKEVDGIDEKNSKDTELICPHCHSSVSSETFVSHILSCDELEVTCRCFSYGCAWKGLQKNLDCHIKSCQYISLEPFLKSQTQRIQNLETENSELRSLIISFHTGLETVSEKVCDISQAPSTSVNTSSSSTRDIIRTQATPTNSQRYFADDLPAASLERVRADHQRLRFEIMSLSSSLGSLELKQNMSLTTECLTIRDEIQELRMAFLVLKGELDEMSRERQNTLSALANLAKNASNRATRSSFNNQGKTNKISDYKL